MSNTAHLESSCTASEPIGITSSCPVRTCCMCTISSPSVPLSKNSISTASPISAFSASRNEASMCWVAAPGVLSTESLSLSASAWAGPAPSNSAATAVPITDFKTFFIVSSLLSWWRPPFPAGGRQAARRGSRRGTGQPATLVSFRRSRLTVSPKPGASGTRSLPSRGLGASTNRFSSMNCDLKWHSTWVPLRKPATWWRLK